MELRILCRIFAEPIGIQSVSLKTHHIMIEDLTSDEFDARFRLVPNHIVPSRGNMFETFDEELDFVRSIDPFRICTLVEGDDGDLYIVSGYHLVNRLGYFILEEPFEFDFIAQY